MGYSVSIVQRTDYLKTDGTASLYLRFIIDRASGRIPLHIAVKPEEFSPTKNKVKLSDPDRERDINLLLGKALAKANDIFVTYRLSEKQLTPKLFKIEYANPSLRNDFLTFIEKEIAAHKGYVTADTIATYKTTLNHLKAWKHYINFLEITPDWPEQWDRWMKGTQKMTQNNRAKQHKNAKKFIRIAIKRGVRIANPYEDFKCTFKQGDIVFLDDAEVDLLYRLYKKEVFPRHLQEDLRKFLFTCYTGPRYSEVNEFHSDNIVDQYLIYKPQKNARFRGVIKVPLTNTARSFLVEQEGKLFQQKQIQTYNRNLKVIGFEAGLRKKLTSHVARHTFATLFLAHGGRVETLRLLLGHADIATTMIYVHVTDKRKEEEIALMERDDLS